ncbi:hypothetical protein D9M72_477550 [compost metagenome]
MPPKTEFWKLKETHRCSSRVEGQHQDTSANEDKRGPHTGGHFRSDGQGGLIGNRKPDPQCHRRKRQRNTDPEGTDGFQSLCRERCAIDENKTEQHQHERHRQGLP